LLAIAATPTFAFQSGTGTASFTLGAGRALDQSYTVIGGRLGYFWADGLEFAVSGEAWRDNKPRIYKFTPEARYVWFAAEPVKPYIGGFVSRTMYSGLPDRNTYGVKGGGYFAVSPNANVSVGLVYEKITSCDSRTYRDCSQLYPEAAFHVRF
jgi:hypothetical protein